MVDQSHDGIRIAFETQSGGREIFPVAVVSQNAGTGLSVVEAFFHFLHVAELEVLAHLLRGDGEQFDCLHEIIAEEMVETALNAFDFLDVLLGERRGEVVSHHPFAVSDDVVDQQVQAVGDPVEYAERQQREEVEESVYDGVEDVHDACMS